MTRSSGEDRPRTAIGNGGSPAYLWFTSAVAALGGLMFGYDVIVISGVIPQVLKDFSLTPAQLGFLVSSVLWGCALGSCTGGVLLDLFGRKKLVLASAALLSVSAIWSSTSPTTLHLILARLMGGIGCGIAATACPLYISEISPETVRGRMVALYHLAVCTGIVICVFVNWGIFSIAQSTDAHLMSAGPMAWLSKEHNWRAMFASEAIPGILFLLTALALPESPRWLVKNRKIAQAEAILKRINGPQKAARVCTEIQETLLLETKMTFFSLFSSRLRRPLLIAVLICVLSEACGISAVLYYGPQLFEQAGLSLGKSLGGFSVLAVVNMIFNLVAIYAIDTAGRRTMLSIGAGGAMIFQAMVGGLYLMEQTGWVTIALLTAFIAFFAFSIGPVKFIVLSEIFPNQIRGKAMALGTLCIWITSAAMAQLFPMMREVMHTGYIFLIFAGDIMALLMVTVFLLPETKGRTIEDIERSWIRAQGPNGYPAR